MAASFVAAAGMTVVKLHVQQEGLTLASIPTQKSRPTYRRAFGFTELITEKLITGVAPEAAKAGSA